MSLWYHERYKREKQYIYIYSPKFVWITCINLLKALLLAGGTEGSDDRVGVTRPTASMTIIAKSQVKKYEAL